MKSTLVPAMRPIGEMTWAKSVTLVNTSFPPLFTHLIVGVPMWEGMVCVCVCVCVYTHLCVCLCVYVYVRAHLSVCVFIPLF